MRKVAHGMWIVVTLQQVDGIWKYSKVGDGCMEKSSPGITRLLSTPLMILFDNGPWITYVRVLM